MDKTDNKKDSKKFYDNRHIIAVVILVTVFCGTLITLMEINSFKRSYTEDEYEIIASRIYDALVSSIDKPVVASQTMANDVFLKDVLKNENKQTEAEMVSCLSGYLSELKKTMNAQTAFVISEGSKRYYTYEGLNKVIDPENDEHDIWYSIFVNSRKAYDLDVDCDQVNGDTWTVFVNARIEDENGKLLGVCGMGYTMNEFQSILKKMEATYGINVNLVDSDEVVQVDTNSVNIENAYLYDAKLGKEKDGYTYRNDDGEYVVMRFVDSLNWFLVVHGVNGFIGMSEIIPVVVNGVLVVVINMLVMFVVLKNPKNKGGV